MTRNLPITISPLLDEQHDSWMPLWRGYQVFYETDIPALVSAVTWTRLLDPPVCGGRESASARLRREPQMKHRGSERWPRGDLGAV
jgi:hypothetical protein